MCNAPENTEWTEPLRKRGILVVAESAEVALAVVERLAALGADVLVATGKASQLSHLLSRVRGSPGKVHGLTADLSRKVEAERVFRWVDSTLVHLDACVSVVEEVVPLWPEGDLDGWHRILEERWVIPLLLIEGAAIRMRPRRRGHLVQVAIGSFGEGGGAANVGNVGSPGSMGGAGGSGSLGGGFGSGDDVEASSGVGAGYGVGNAHAGGSGSSGLGAGGSGDEPVWQSLREMIEARREGLRRAGIRLTILEVEGERGGISVPFPTLSPPVWGQGGYAHGVGGSGGMASGVGESGMGGSCGLESGARCPFPEDVAAAVEFCLGEPRRAVVEAIRLRAPCGGGRGVCELRPEAWSEVRSAHHRERG